jgi:predicted SprT family Zn-dependent metalloprotease
MPRKESRPLTAPAPEPTNDQWTSYQHAFRYFNKELFGGQLRQPILNLSRHRGAQGFHRARAFLSRELTQLTDDELRAWVATNSDTHDGKVVCVSEISLNPDCLGREPQWIMSVLVHEMAHYWQHHFGKPSRNGYHSAEWVRKMESLGLTPFAVDAAGRPTGKQTGQRVSHRIVPGGKFDAAMQAMPQEYILPWLALRPPDKEQKEKKESQKKIKLTCPECDLAAWITEEDALNGKEVQCVECNQRLLDNEELKEYKND